MDEICERRALFYLSMTDTLERNPSCFPQKKSLGQVVFDQVLRRLGVLERDYFGLQHEDEQKTLVRKRNPGIQWNIP